MLVVQEYAAATAEAEMAEAKSVRQGEEAEAFRRIADEKRLLAYQLADLWTGLFSPSSSSVLKRNCLIHMVTNLCFQYTVLACVWSQEYGAVKMKCMFEFGHCVLLSS